MSFRDFVVQKLTVATVFSDDFPTSESIEVLPYNIDKIRKNPTANRCFNMIIDAAASVEYTMVDMEVKLDSNSSLRPKTILQLLNRQANRQMDANFFKRCIITDILAEGNAFVLVDAGKLYYLPAKDMKVVGDSSRLVKEYVFKGKTHFKPEEIIHIKDNSVKSILVGESRLQALNDIVDLHKKMKDFQKNFFSNNAMPGIILKSPNTLTDKLKQRKLRQWAQEFNPTSGARKPAFLDGGIEVDNLNTSTFREMDFEQSIQSLEKDIAKAMGVPPLLLDGGNNANITPNVRLFYQETIMPLCEKIADAFANYFGYKIVPNEVGIPALQPDLRDLANYVSTLVNGGVMYPNEGRIAVGLERDPDPTSDQLRIPQNVAGSAIDSSQGGRPKEDKPDE